MKRIMTLSAGVLAFCASALAASAFNCLTINRIDGTSDHFALDRATTVSATADGGVKLVGTDVTVIYPSDEVDSYTFENYTFGSVKYDGDKENLASISSPQVNPISFSIADGTLTVHGAEPGSTLNLIDIQGRVVDSARASESGSATLRGNSGVYLLNINRTTLKIML